MRALLRVPRFPGLLGTWTIGNFADSALFLTLAVWAKDLTGSSGAAGMVFFCLGAPVLASPLFGLLADRVRRRPLLVAGNLLAAAAVLLLVTIDRASDVWLLYLVTVLYGALGSLNSAAQSGLLRTLLPDELLGSANAAFMTIDQGLRVLTPVVGAALYAGWGGPALAVAVAAMLVLTAAGLALLRIPEPRAVRAALPDALSDSGFRALAAGFAHVRRTPLVRTMVIALGASLAVIGMYDSLLFAVVEHGLGRPAAFFGVLMSAQGAGSILGGLTASWVLRRLGPVRAVAAGLGVMAVAGLGFLTTSTVAVLIGSAVAGVAIPWAFVALATTRQRLTPANLQGRTAAATNVALQLPQLVATATGAVLVGAVDYRVLTVVAAAVIAAAALWAVTRRGAGPVNAVVGQESADVADSGSVVALPDVLPPAAAAVVTPDR